MPKRSRAYSALPLPAERALRQLGENLATARERRRQSRRVWAARIGVSVPTLIRMEEGDPGVGVGLVATALWMVGGLDALAELADPQSDQGALELDVRAARRRRKRSDDKSAASATSTTFRSTAAKPR